jgi:hypothetical protein
MDNEFAVITVKIIEKASEFRYLEYVFSYQRRGMKIKLQFYNKINYFKEKFRKIHFNTQTL